MQIDYSGHRMLDCVSSDTEQRAQTIPLHAKYLRQKPISIGICKKTTELKSRVLKEKQKEIDKSNEILLKKMLYIDSQPSNFLANTIKYQKVSLKTAEKMQKSKARLKEENKKLKLRILNTQSYYKLEKFKQDYSFLIKVKKSHKKLKNNSLNNDKRAKEDLAYFDMLLTKELKRQEMYKKYFFF